MNETEFLAKYASGDAAARVIEINVSPSGDENFRRDGYSPFIVVRDQFGRTLVLNPMSFDDHLCVDAHAFVNGKDARTGVFGMEAGRRVTFEQAPGTSHSWGATKLLALLLGDQADTPDA